MLMSPVVVIVPAAVVATAEPVTSMSPAALSMAPPIVAVSSASISIGPVVLLAPLTVTVPVCEVRLRESRRSLAPTLSTVTAPDWLVICRANGPSTSVPKVTAPSAVLVMLLSPDSSTLALSAKSMAPATVILLLMIPIPAASTSRPASGTELPIAPSTTLPTVATSCKVSVPPAASSVPLALKVMLPLFEV